MSELAFNINGERFDLPASAACWRVRRFKASGRGTPEVVFSDDGLPLIIPIDTEIGEFRTLVRNVPGRYRLDPVDDNHKPCEDGTGAYLQLSDESAAREATSPKRSEGDELLREIVRANAAMVTTIAEKFATVMDSAATLLRAADGAGMPSREPAVVPLQLATAWRNAERPIDRDEDDEEDDDGDEERAGTMQLVRVIENVASQAMPLVKHHIHTKLMGLSPEQSIAMMGGAGPVPRTTTASASAGASTARQSSPHEERSVTDAPTADSSANFFVHLAAIEQRLTPEESALAKRAIRQMPPEALASWKDQILRMSPDQAAELVRAECRRIGKQQPNDDANSRAVQSEKEAA